MTLLEVKNLSVTLKTARGPAMAVRDLSFALERGESLGIVGESGCGKSITALALMGLLPENSETTGSVLLEGENLLEKSETDMCDMRGNRIAMIFQEPMTSLNPVHRVGHQIMEPLLLHRKLSKAEATDEARALLERVGIPNPAERLNNYPHQLSGGQRQRVMIAMALSCDPDVLIADEPTTALDVTIQDQILELIQDLVSEQGMALILISHDLGVIAENVENVLVMYGGNKVETGPTANVFQNLAHPYTQGLFAAIPKLGQGRGSRLMTIPGTVPELVDLPAGCSFAGRCPIALDNCHTDIPPQQDLENLHSAACVNLQEALSKREAGLYR